MSTLTARLTAHDFFIHAPSIVYPRWADARLVQIGILAGFTLIGKLALGFQVSWLQIGAAILSVCLLDVAITYWRSGALLVPASGLISGLSLGLLLRSPELWPFLLAGILTVLGKHLIRVHGRHVFNPSNLGLLLVLALPWAHGTVTPGQWGRSWMVVFLVLNLGFFIIYKIRRLHLVAAFVLSFATFGLLRDALGVASIASLSASVASAAFLLFTFFMLTDPQTSPGTVEGRVVYAVAVAGADAALRTLGVPDSLFVALAMVCAGYVLLRTAVGASVPASIWQTASTRALPVPAPALMAGRGAPDQAQGSGSQSGRWTNPTDSEKERTTAV